MNTLMNKVYFAGLKAKSAIRDMLTKENGEANIVAVILVIAIVVVLAIIFKDSIAKLFKSIWAGIIDNSGGINDQIV